MGGQVTKFVGDVAKAGLKGATSYVLGKYVPFVGGHIAQYINSKYSKGGVLLEVGGTPPDLPDGFKPKKIDTPAQLKDLIRKFPEQAQKAGLSVEKVDDEVKEAKAVSKAVGGLLRKGVSKMESEMEYDRADVPKNPVLQPVKEKKMSKGGKLTKKDLEDAGPAGGEHMAKRPVLAVGGNPKPKKERTKAQIEATKRLVEMNRKKREKK
jgi:hypothetical protein